MRYTELGQELDAILKQRQAISVGMYGFTPKEGHEEEHKRLTDQAEEIRKQMRRARYGTDE